MDVPSLWLWSIAIMISCLFLGLHYPQCILRVPHFCSKYTVPRSDSSLVSIIFQHIIIPEVSVLFVEFRSFFPHISALLVSNFVATRRLLAFCRIQVFFPHISALLLSNFVATDVYALSLKNLKSLPAVFFPFLVWAKFWVAFWVAIWWPNLQQMQEVPCCC